MADGTQVLPQNQPGTGGEIFQLPEKFKDKPPEEIARAYVELEKQFGQRADYDELKRRSTESEASVRQRDAALQSWEQYRPYLEKLGWDTAKLERLASGQGGPAQTEVSMEAWASKWASAPPEEQIPFLLQTVLAPLFQNAMGEYTKNLMTHLQTQTQQQAALQAQKDKLLVSWLKAAFPEKSQALDNIYTAAMERAQKMKEGGWDPFQAVMESEMSKTQRDEEEKKLRQQIRAEVEQELQAKNAPTVPRNQPLRGGSNDRPRGRDAIRQAAVKAALEKAPHLAR